MRGSCSSSASAAPTSAEPPAELPSPILPPHHQRWLDQLVGDLHLPAETRATCGDCVMCRQPGGYSAATKCCTFMPQLTNFLVGAMIAQQPALIEASSAQRRTPFGMIAAPGRQQRFEAMVAAGHFGQDEALRCPYYQADSGHCGIWHAREAQCSTWFCKFEHGPRGKELWTAVLALFQNIEAALARWCVAEHGLDLHAGGRDDAEAWGTWWGREAQFYRQCSAAVDALDGASLRALLPTVHVDLASTVRNAHARLAQPLHLISLGSKPP